MLPLLVNKDEYTSLRPAYLNASSIIGICVKVEWRHHDRCHRLCIGVLHGWHYQLETRQRPASSNGQENLQSE